MVNGIYADGNSSSRIYCPDSFRGLNTGQNGRLTVHAGLRSMKVEMMTDSSLSGDEIRISQDVLDYLSIPQGIKYQLRLVKNGPYTDIDIGPVIGLLMAKKSDKLSRGVLRELLDYTVLYGETNGLICAFSAEGIDFENRLIEGYYYDPNTNKAANMWKKSILPMPPAIYRRAVLDTRTEKRLKRVTGNRMFNSYFFDKAQFWQMVSKDQNVRSSVPDTLIYNSFDDVENMLSAYGEAYMKPVHGTLARGLMKVSKSGDKYIFQDKDYDKPMEPMVKEEIIKYINHTVGRRQYLVQQALCPITVDDRFTDFRVIMQKDHSMKWICTGIIGFLGHKGNICSNWGYQTGFDDIFKRLLGYPPEEAARIKDAVVDTCKRACEMLDNTGENYGDFGIDVLIDKSYKPWILEINKRHYHIVPLWARDVETYYKVKTNPIKYASAMCGF